MSSKYADAIVHIRRIVEDDGFRWTDEVITQFLVRSVNQVRRKTGANFTRTALNMVTGTQAYDIQGSGRILAVRIIPDPVAEPKALQELPFYQLPIYAEANAEPEYFALNTMAGVNEDQYAIHLYPAPDRTATGAILIEQDEEIQSATEDDYIQLLPKFLFPVIWLTAGELLIEIADGAYTQKGHYYVEKAEKEIAGDAYVNSLSFWNNPASRGFP
jgi:hypothetical protein